MEQTASSVLNMFPDLELAMEEGEPQLAAGFFNMVRLPNNTLHYQTSPWLDLIIVLTLN